MVCIVCYCDPKVLNVLKVPKDPKDPKDLKDSKDPKIQSQAIIQI